MGVIVRLIRRMRRRVYRAARQVFFTAPRTVAAGHGFPKGANAMAGSVLGDNAHAGTRKGWSA